MIIDNHNALFLILVHQIDYQKIKFQLFIHSEKTPKGANFKRKTKKGKKNILKPNE